MPAASPLFGTDVAQITDYDPTHEYVLLRRGGAVIPSDTHGVASPGAGVGHVPRGLRLSSLRRIPGGLEPRAMAEDVRLAIDREDHAAFVAPCFVLRVSL